MNYLLNKLFNRQSEKPSNELSRAYGAVDHIFQRILLPLVCFSYTQIYNFLNATEFCVIKCL